MGELGVCRRERPKEEKGLVATVRSGVQKSTRMSMRRRRRVKDEERDDLLVGDDIDVGLLWVELDCVELEGRSKEVDGVFSVPFAGERPSV